MKFLKKVWILVTSLLGGISATTESPGTPVGKTESLLGQAFAETYKIKLDAAAAALRQIADLTGNNPAIDPKYRDAIHKIASAGYEAASK